LGTCSDTCRRAEGLLHIHHEAQRGCLWREPRRRSPELHLVLRHADGLHLGDRHTAPVVSRVGPGAVLVEGVGAVEEGAAARAAVALAPQRDAGWGLFRAGHLLSSFPPFTTPNGWFIAISVAWASLRLRKASTVERSALVTFTSFILR